MDKLLFQFGNRVRSLRKAQGLSQEKLAGKADLHPTYVGAVERGERNLSLSAIKKIAKGLQVNIPELFVFDTFKKTADEKELIGAEIMRLLISLDTKTLRIVSKVIKQILHLSKN